MFVCARSWLMKVLSPYFPHLAFPNFGTAFGLSFFFDRSYTFHCQSRIPRALLAVHHSPDAYSRRDFAISSDCAFHFRTYMYVFCSCIGFYTNYEHVFRQQGHSSRYLNFLLRRKEFLFEVGFNLSVAFSYNVFLDRSSRKSILSLG